MKLFNIDWWLLKRAFQGGERPHVIDSTNHRVGACALSVKHGGEQFVVMNKYVKPVHSVEITCHGGGGGGKLPLDAVSNTVLHNMDEIDQLDTRVGPAGGGRGSIGNGATGGNGGRGCFEAAGINTGLEPHRHWREQFVGKTGPEGGRGPEQFIGRLQASVSTNVPYKVDTEFAAFINAHLVGKEIKTACVHDTGCPVHEVRIGFADGTAVGIYSEHDEGFAIEHCEPLGGSHSV
jgi:hypothetical protein